MSILALRSARVAGFTLLVVLIVAFLLSAGTLQRSALIYSESSVSDAEVSSVERLLVDSALGDIRDAEQRRLSLSDDEINLLLRYATELVGVEDEISSRVYLPGDTLLAEVSVRLLASLPLFLNLRAGFTSDNARLRLSSLQIGHLRIPSGLVSSLSAQVQQRYLEKQAAFRGIMDLMQGVEQITLAPDRLELDFTWEPGLLSLVRTQAQALFLTASDQPLIAAQYRQLAETVSDIPATVRAIPLSALLKPLFAQALRQSQSGADPVAVNRALLVTVAAYVNQESIEQWLAPELATAVSRPPFIEVRIQQRQDLAQHVASSAAIAATAGIGVARILSSVKENYDARYRSGFSFSDLTANRAGMLLGALATSSPENALVLQQRLARLTGDGDYLPFLTNNRDGLTESDFSARYRHENSADYQARLQEIDALLYQLPLFDNLSVN